MRNAYAPILTIAISATRMGMGYFSSISGPTLFYLANNVDVSISTLSYMFMGRSIGVVSGAILGGLVKRRNPNFGQLLGLGAAIGLLGIVSLIIPWIRAFWILVLDITLGGIMFGYLDAGLQALILQLWGEGGSRSHIQLFHLTFVIGAFAAPIIVQPFLVMADASSPSSSRCSRVLNDMESNYNITTVAYTTDATVASEQDNFNPVGWAYNIAAVWMVLAGIALMALSRCNVEEKISSVVAQEGNSSEVREEEPFCDLIWLFLPVVGYYFCSVATENVFYNFMYSVSVCSDLKFSITEAALANSLVWTGLGVGRLSGIVAAKYFSPRIIIIVTIAASIVDSLLMVLFGEHNAWMAWIIAFCHGLTPSVMFPSGVSWLSQITNVSGTYMFIFSIGAALGVLTMMPLAGYLFDNISPFSVMTQVFVLAAINAVFFGLALFAGKKHRQFLVHKTASGDCELEKQAMPKGHEEDSLDKADKAI